MKNFDNSLDTILDSSMIGDIYDTSFLDDPDLSNTNQKTSTKTQLSNHSNTGKSEQKNDLPPQHSVRSTVQDSPYSVTEFCNTVKKIISQLKKVTIIGEVSNHSARRDWVYFSLKDESSLISCMVKSSVIAKFESYTQSKFTNSLKVIIVANPSFYSVRGQLTLICEKITLSGKAENKIKTVLEQLQNAGFFPRQLKSIPTLIKRVAVITSLNGQAIKDVCATIRKRNPFIEIIIAEAIVQGSNAPSSIMKALYNVNILNGSYPIDVILVVRGGGSGEDLDAYNDYMLNAYLCSSQIPIISGVGHEGDYTVIDYMSDLRAATPTAAATSVSTDVSSLIDRLNNAKSALHYFMNQAITNHNVKLQNYRNKLELLDPIKVAQENTLKIANTRNVLISLMKSILFDRQTKLNTAFNTLKLANPIKNINEQSFQVNAYKKSLQIQIDKNLEQLRFNLKEQITALNAMNPLAILLKGYSVTSLNEKIITKANDLNKGDIIQTKLSEGSVRSEVIEIIE